MLIDNVPSIKEVSMKKKNYNYVFKNLYLWINSKCICLLKIKQINHASMLDAGYATSKFRWEVLLLLIVINIIKMFSCAKKGNRYFPILLKITIIV